MQSRLEPRLALPDDPMLEDDEVDVVLFVNTLYLISNREQYLHRLLPAIRPGGRVVIVDWKQAGNSPGARPGRPHRAGRPRPYAGAGRLRGGKYG